MTTVADLLSGQAKKNYPEEERDYAGALEPLKEAANKERVFRLRLLLDPNEAKIIDGWILIEKEVVARNRREALGRFGVEVD